MDIKILGKEHITEFRNLSYYGYPNSRDFSEDGIASYDRELDLITDENSGVISYGIFIDDVLVAVTKSIDFQMNVYGKMTDTSGYGTLAVHPLYKKRGLGADLTLYYEEEAKKRGFDTTFLLPFRPDYYQKFGYGFSTKMDLYQVDLKYCAEFDSPYTVKLIDSVEDVFTCHEEVTELTHGMVNLLVLEKEFIKNDFNDLETMFIGVYDKDKLIGYTSYKIESLVKENYTKNYIKAKDIVVRDSDSLRTIFSYFKEQSDLAEFVEFYTQIQGMEHFFSNPLDRSYGFMANGYLQTNRQAIGLMIKIIDPELWIKRHGESVNMPSEITWNIEGEKVGSGDYEVTINKSHLSSLWYGAVSFMSLYKAGLVKCNKKVVPLLRKTFPGDNPPQNNTDF